MGVEFDMKRAVDGEIAIVNRQDRVEEITDDIKGALVSGIFRPAHAASLRGKLFLAQGQCFGRCGLASLDEGREGPALLARQFRHGRTKVVELL